MPSPAVTLADYAPAWREPLVRLWREAFEFGVGIVDPHTPEEQAAYFDNVVLAENSVRLALSGNQLLGFAAATPESVAQLHVRVGHHRQGIGSALLGWAKAQSGGSLWLYTFARNQVAQRFYEHHGFHVVARGFEPTWQLDDVKYAWPAPA